MEPSEVKDFIKNAKSVVSSVHAELRYATSAWRTAQYMLNDNEKMKLKCDIRIAMRYLLDAEAELDKRNDEP